MSLVKWKKENELYPSLWSFFDDFWGKDLFNGIQTGTSMPAVNISEGDAYFEIEVAAPGLKKEDFKVSLDFNILTISAEQKEEKEEKEGKTVKRREFSFTSFTRSFTLPDSVKAENIEAAYEDGVLKLVLPKKEKSKKALPKEIVVN